MRQIIPRLLAAITILLTGLLSLWSTPAHGQTSVPNPSTAGLKVYGPGGPQGPMKECAQVFGQREHLPVEVVVGPEGKWIEQAKGDADIFFGGAEYMLTALSLEHPNLVDTGSRVSLWVRPAGILVRKGNPKNVHCLADLAKAGVRLVDVEGAGQTGLWEDLAGRDPQTLAGIARNITLSVKTSAEAIEKWKAGQPELDAWITYASWHELLKEQTDLVALPEGQTLYRGTPAALATGTKHPEQAARFLAFLQTDEAHAIFQKWGWK